MDCSELKKRQKKRAADKKKAEKEAQKAEAKKKKEEEEKNNPKKKAAANAFDEEEKDPSKYTDNRKQFVQGIRDAGTNPYPHKFTRTHRIDQFRREYDEAVTENDTFVED